MTYPIVDVSKWTVLSVEEMGSKPKFWLENHLGEKWLFKHSARPLVGDDWSEKIAAEVAELLSIPHAVVELARFGDKRGVISKDLVGKMDSPELVLGNNLLVEADASYPLSHRYKVAKHTLDRVFQVLGADYIGLPEGTPADAALTRATDLFLGFLLLDALVGNTDRHHENWAILQYAAVESRRRAVLCPTFDHASCLGHNLTDGERVKRLVTRDRGYAVPAYVKRARSALYLAEGDPHPMSPIDAFEAGEARRPDAGSYWRRLIRGLEPGILEGLVERVPDGLMSTPARDFAQALLIHHRQLLIQERKA